VWSQDRAHIVNLGRTPVASRGTNDLHSIQQNNIEGENNKTITFIRVEKFARELKVSGTGDFLSGKMFSKLMNVAQEACEWALTKESRPNCTIVIPELNPYYWGGLLFFFEMATAYEGEFLNLNAYDQPGVEGYKNYMYFKLGKPGLAAGVKEEILRRPLKKKPKLIF
jgi:glucose-6-phosphate isomerase